MPGPTSDPGALVFGFHPIRELLRHRPHEAVRLWISARQGKRRAEIENLCRRHRLPFEDVAPAKLAAWSGDRVHNGFGAEVRTVRADVEAGGDPELVLLVEDIQDPRNLGALMRVCEGAGVGKLLVRDRGSAPLSPVVMETAAGAGEWLEVERVTNSSQELERLQGEGFWAYGADAAGQPPWKIDLTGKVVLCLGGEANGLRERTRKNCDALVGLPMRGRVESLNLATAAAALLYEAVRQRTSD